ncbi:hypothetical protein ANO14919_076710 [Xylariales sp. No.14919]|nr:hypothetical protein F5X98DRAFT_374838 [Xylaria grammica]GAW18197.1 hypothetical protein ANO14919_076710 [Xylariales sp. No.14919]
MYLPRGPLLGILTNYADGRLFSMIGLAEYERYHYRSEFGKRGLVDGPFGPELKSAPFYEDAGVITKSIHELMENFINPYYINDRVVAQDIELQAWDRGTRATRVYGSLRINTKPVSESLILLQAPIIAFHSRQALTPNSSICKPSPISSHIRPV